MTEEEKALRHRIDDHCVFKALAPALSQEPPWPLTIVQTLRVAVETALRPAAMPSPYSGFVAIGNPVDLLMRLRVLFGEAEGEKMVLAPEDFTSWVIVLRLEGRKTPPVV